MSNSFVFQNAQIKSRESKLLTLQGVQRLFDAQNVKDAMKVVIELGLANGMTTEDEDFDTVFKNEEENLCTLLKEMNVKGALDVFLLENDYVNLKIASKAYATKSDDTHFLPDGLYEAQKIVEALSAEEIVGFDKHFLSAIKGVLEILNGENPNPRAIDNYLDKKMYEHIFSSVSKSGKEAKAYYEKKVDFANIGAFARAQKLGLDEEFFRACFIEGGKIPLAKFIEQDTTLDTFALKMKDTEFEKIASDLAQSKNAVAFEVASENALLKEWKDADFDMFSIAPIAAYYLTKKTELKVVKLIVAGIKNHVDPQIIKERMRELYA